MHAAVSRSLSRRCKLHREQYPRCAPLFLLLHSMLAGLKRQWEHAGHMEWAWDFARVLLGACLPCSQHNAPHAGSTPIPDELRLVLYALHQQATVGPCTEAKPWGWNVVESAKWESWNQLGNMSSVEAMRLYVKMVEDDQVRSHMQIHACMWLAR